MEEDRLNQETLTMIRIERPKTPPADLKGTKASPSPGEKEMAKAIEFYAKKRNQTKPFPFAAYKAKTVVAELNKLLAGKCAYCESKYRATAPVDVEHFRPKGGYFVLDTSQKKSGKKSGKSSKKSSQPAVPKFVLKKPGYYWLAAVWENLLPSCIDCNRERNQQVPDETDPQKFKTIKVGKGSNFPLVDEKKRLDSPKSRKREEPLILDPTVDKPEKHLEFTEEGVVRPALVKKKPSLKGAESIRVYALQRMGLVQERRDRARMVLAQIQRVRELLEDFNRRPKDRQLERRLDREMEELERYAKPEEVYAGMARQLIKKFFGPLK
ncbi:MAG TPA: hypothetical protein VEV81_01570 [Pyrinomonadaceae bacterium]|nr:hypothetical protein [Pyrinomonadaceae bacterium]